METFKCRRCGYETKYKHVIKSHYARKKTCEPKLEDISISELEKELEPAAETQGTIECFFCDKKFNFRSNMLKHVRVCKHKKSVGDIKSVQGEIEILRNEVKELEGLRNEVKELEGLRNEVKELRNVIAKGEGSKVTNNNYSKCNFNSINITNFGCESIEHLPVSFLNGCFAKKDIATLMREVHFDTEFPKNHNLRLKSKKQKLIEVYTNKRWETKDQDKVLEELVQSGYRILRLHGRKNRECIMEDEDLDDDEFADVVRWLETIYDDKKAQQPIKRELLLIIMNNTPYIVAKDDTAVG